MGKIYLNSENKLVVETENGKINPDGTKTVEIDNEGQYTISGSDVAVLLNMINGNNVLFKKYVFNRMSLGCHIYKTIQVFANEKLSDVIKEITFLQDEIRDENESLKNAIKKYNEDKGFFWRPIEI